MSDTALVTVLIPARNEEQDIERCLQAVLAQDYPHNRMEIVLVDGESPDRTTTIAAEVLGRGNIGWKIVDNPTGTTPSNLNAGLAVASGALLCRVDARSVIPPEYIRRCVEVLDNRTDVMVTGGAQVAVTRDAASKSIGIARALNNRYAMGGARYRSGAASGPSETVYLGAFRTDQLRAVGGWDERMLTNQDFELNRRLGRVGLVWFDARLSVGYVPRASLGDLWTQYHRFGRWKVRYWRVTGDPPLPRQMVLAVGAPAVAVGGLCILARISSARRRAGGLVALGVAAVAMEDRGSGGPDGGAADRIVSVASMAVVSAAWVSGVWRELVASRR